MSPRIRYEIATWNDDLARSRAAYRADRLVEDGWCASCGTRKVGGFARRCRPCGKAGRGER